MGWRFIFGQAVEEALSRQHRTHSSGLGLHVPAAHEPEPIFQNVVATERTPLFD
jgi:hypothetical protein